MKKIFLLFLSGFLSLGTLFSQSTKPAYMLFDKEGHPCDYADMIKTFLRADVVLLGEYHNNPISHWMQLEITRSLHEKKGDNLMLGAEMFEADMQLMLDEYIRKEYSTKRFEADARLWGNYSTDYEPLVDFARENGLRFIATNVPRRYAEMVHKKGGADILDKLSDEAKRFMAPLPIPFKPDSVMLSEGSIMSMMSNDPLAISKAQALKDASMAYFIAANMKKKTVFVHYNGTFHSDNWDGIVYFLKQYAPKLKVMTLSTAQQDEVQELDEAYRGVADFVLCVPSSMTRTY